MTGLQRMRREYQRARKRGDGVFLIDMDLLEDPSTFDMKDLYDEACIFGERCKHHNTDHTAEKCETWDEYRAGLEYDLHVAPYIPPLKKHLRRLYDAGKVTANWTDQDVIDFARWIGYIAREDR